MEQVWEINRFATEDCLPHLTLYLDLEPEVGLARIAANAQREVNRLDLESLAFHRKVREGYRQVAGMFPERFITLNAAVSQEELAEQAWPLVSELLRKK